jgi:GNAT superfamily N-acetyltransferase
MNLVRLTDNQFNVLIVPLLQRVLGTDAAPSRVEPENELIDTWAYFDKGNVVGTVGLGEEITTAKIWLGYFGVHPDYLRLGIGTKLIESIEAEAEKRGYKWIFVETYSSPRYDAANKFYTTMGYKKAGYLENYTVEGYSVIYYIKKLGI